MILTIRNSAAFDNTKKHSVTSELELATSDASILRVVDGRTVAGMSAGNATLTVAWVNCGKELRGAGTRNYFPIPVVNRRYR